MISRDAGNVYRKRRRTREAKKKEKETGATTRPTCTGDLERLESNHTERQGLVAASRIAGHLAGSRRIDALLHPSSSFTGSGQIGGRLQPRRTFQSSFEFKHAPSFRAIRSLGCRQVLTPKVTLRNLQGPSGSGSCRSMPTVLCISPGPCCKDPCARAPVLAVALRSQVDAVGADLLRDLLPARAGPGTLRGPVARLCLGRRWQTHCASFRSIHSIPLWTGTTMFCDYAKDQLETGGK